MKYVLKYTGRILLVILTTLILVIGILYSAMWVLVNGPSPNAKRLFVLSVKETSAVGFLANLYLSESEIDEILSVNVDIEHEVAENIDTSLINIPAAAEKAEPVLTEAKNTYEVQTVQSEASQKPDIKPEIAAETEPAEPEPDIELIDISGPSYKGKLMIVKDPSRIFVGIPGEYGEGKSGMSVYNMVNKYGCTAGVNAGGFYDPNGSGTGGIPEGIVIYQGELKWGDLSSSYSIAGFDKNNILHVGSMTGKAAIENEIQYAVSFGPALIINGKPCNEKYTMGGGINPRTAVGQRADGAVLLLVVNGRQLESLGATLDDLIEVMLKYGAVNATNLDGGSSSLMIYNGEYITTSSYVYGERVVATSILVK